MFPVHLGLSLVGIYGCLGYSAPGSLPSYPVLDARPSQKFQQAQPPLSQSSVTMIMRTLLSMVYGLFKPC